MLTWHSVVNQQRARTGISIPDHLTYSNSSYNCCICRLWVAFTANITRNISVEQTPLIALFAPRPDIFNDRSVALLWTRENNEMREVAPPSTNLPLFKTYVYKDKHGQYLLCAHHTKQRINKKQQLNTHMHRGYTHLCPNKVQSFIYN